MIVAFLANRACSVLVMSLVYSAVVGNEPARNWRGTTLSAAFATEGIVMQSGDRGDLDRC